MSRPWLCRAAPHHRRHSATLRDDRNAGPRRERPRLGQREGQRDAVAIVHEAQTIRTFNGHAAGARDRGDLVLNRPPFRARLGESGRKDHDAADAARGTGLPRPRQCRPTEWQERRSRPPYGKSAICADATQTAKLRSRSDGPDGYRRKSQSAPDCRARSRQALPASMKCRQSPPTSDSAGARPRNAEHWPDDARHRP